MKVALTADWHIGRELELDRLQLKAMADACVEKKVELLCVAGDIFDRPNCVTPRYGTGAVQLVLDQFLAVVHSAGIATVMVSGNHDKAGEGHASALSVFNRAKVPLASVYDQGLASGNLWQHRNEDVGIVFVPWQYNSKVSFHDQVMKHVSGLRHGTPKLLLAHVSVVGALMNSTKACEGGSWSVTREELDDLAKHFDRICLGDFHRRQDLTGGKGGYVGAIRQLDFGEEGNPAGFEIWDTETGEVEWIELDAAPKHRTYKITSVEQWPAPEANVRQRVQCIGFVPESALVREVEQGGGKVEVFLERQERVSRAAEVAEGIITKPHELIRLWASQQSGGVDIEALCKLHDEIGVN